MNTNISMVSPILHSLKVKKRLKIRYENHKPSFRPRSHLSASDLAKYYWKLFDKDPVPAIKFSIVKRVQGNTLLITATYV